MSKLRRLYCCPIMVFCILFIMSGSSLHYIVRIVAAISPTADRPHVSDKNKFVWFREWIEWIEDKRQYRPCRWWTSFYGERTFKRYFYIQLPVPDLAYPVSRKVNILIYET